MSDTGKRSVSDRKCQEAGNKPALPLSPLIVLVLCGLFRRASLVAQMVKNLPAGRRPGFDPWVKKIPWSREWLPTPVFLPGKFHGQRNLVVYSAWGCKELDMTEHAHTRVYVCIYMYMYIYMYIYIRVCVCVCVCMCIFKSSYSMDLE